MSQTILLDKNNLKKEKKKKKKKKTKTQKQKTKQNKQELYIIIAGSLRSCFRMLSLLTFWILFR